MYRPNRPSNTNSSSRSGWYAPRKKHRHPKEDPEGPSVTESGRYKLKLRSPKEWCAANKVNYAENEDLFVDEKTVKKRRKTCFGCEARKEEICTECNCTIETRTILKYKPCPLGKWK